MARTYKVKRNQGLMAVARDVYGEQHADKYMLIYNANKTAIGNDPNKVRAGLVLTIPDLSEEPVSELKLKHISVGNEGSIWAAGEADGKVFRLYVYGDGEGQGWTPIEGGNARIIAAVDWANAWLVNQDGEIWRVEDAHSVIADGTWTQVATHSGEADAKTISVGADGSVWYAQEEGTIFRLYGDADAVGWVPDKLGKAVVIAAVDFENAWCVNKEGDIWRLENAYSLEDGGTWTQIPTHSDERDAKTISVGVDGSVWYVDTHGAVYFWQMIADAWQTAWDQGQMGKADVIAVHDQGDVWCLNDKGKVWRTVDTKTDGYQWRQVVEGDFDQSL